MTETPIVPIPPTILPPALEYKVVPAGAGSGGGEIPSDNGTPLIFQDLRYIDIEDSIAGEGVQLMGHVVMCRMYQLTIITDLEGNETKIKTYPPYEITQSELTIASPESPLFINQIDPPEENTTLYGAELRSYAGGEWAVAGIRDMSTYDYYRVFDQAEVSWLPRASTLEQDYIVPGEHGFHYPYEPEVDHDRPRPKYPMDTISAWVPDPRESVDVIYTLVTNGESVSITHPVFQDMDNMTEKLKRVLDRCYFTHGLYHNGLYFNEADRNYNINGVIRGNPVEIYDVDDNLVRTESFNADEELISLVREPIYPFRGELITTVDRDEDSETFGQLLNVEIRNPGALYPKNFILKFRDMDWYTEAGEAPIARAIVSPVERGDPVEVPVTLPDGTIQMQMRAGRLSGGNITEIEIIKPGEGIRRIGRVGMGNTDLTNTRYDYDEGFMNTRDLDPRVPIEKRKKDD